MRNKNTSWGLAVSSSDEKKMNIEKVKTKKFFKLGKNGRWFGIFATYGKLHSWLKFTTALDLSWKLHTIWYRIPLCISINELIRNVPDIPFLMHDGPSWLQGWCPWEILNAPIELSYELHTSWYTTPLSIFKIEKDRSGIDQEVFLTLEDIPD